MTMGTQFVAGVEMYTEACYKCGVPFAMTLDFQRRRLKDRQDFYCPAGHAQHYIGQTPEEKLRVELERQRQITDAERARAVRIEQERDQVARAHNRMRQRVMNGVCPCCNRTFQNLMQHMKTEHAGDLNVGTLRQAFGMTQAAVAQEAGVDPVHVSLYERGRPVTGWAKSAIDGWVDRHAGAAKGKMPAVAPS
jgi:DNA-binding XRE family transcriptional regulator